MAKLVGNALPLTDDRPKRLSNHLPGLARGTEVFSSWTETSVAAEEFLRSATIGERWPDALRRFTVPYFEYQAMIEEIYYFPPVTRDPYRSMAELHSVLTRTPLRTLVLWQMGLGSDEVAVFRRLAAGNEGDPRFLAPLGIWAMAERRFDLSASAFEAEWRAGGDLRALRMQLFALCMADRVNEAVEIVSDLDGSVLEALRDEDSWRWMAEKFLDIAGAELN